MRLFGFVSVSVGKLRRFLRCESLYYGAAGGADEIECSVSVSSDVRGMLTRRIYLSADGAFTARNHLSAFFHGVPFMLGALNSAVGADVCTAVFRYERVLGYSFSAVRAHIFTRSALRKSVIYLT